MLDTHLCIGHTFFWAGKDGPENKELVDELEVELLIIGIILL